MKVTTHPASAVTHVPSNMTDDELVRHIEHHYPNLPGPLLVLLNRFARQEHVTSELEKNLQTLEKVHDATVDTMALGITVQCAHCGSKTDVAFEGA